jgi:hypothetical protein
MLTSMPGTLEIAEGAADNDPDIGLRTVAALRALTKRLEILLQAATFHSFRILP